MAVDRLALVALWAVVLVSLPLARFALGDEMLAQGITAGVLAQSAAVWSVVARGGWSWRRALLAGSAGLGLSWLAEWLGSAHGLPFGRYEYTGALQPQLLGVPLLVPLAWIMMLPPAWAVAAALLGRHARSRWAFALVSAAALTAWDLLLDPQMVAWSFWRWDPPGGYFGIPWSNFLGWLAVGGGISLLVGAADVPAEPLLLIYGLTWLLQSLGSAFFWGQPGPALVGFLVMGAILAGALARSGRLGKFR